MQFLVFSETLLKKHDSEESWQLSKEFFKTIQSNRKTLLKDKGGGVMLVVPKSLNPKLRKDLNHLIKESFESLCVECNLTNDYANKCKTTYQYQSQSQKMIYQSFPRRIIYKHRLCSH